MSFSRTPAPLELLLSSVRMTNQFQEVRFRTPARAVVGSPAPLQGQPFQQVLDALDRTSMSINQAETGPSGPSAKWEHLLATRKMTVGPAHFEHQVAHRGTPTALVLKLTQAGHLSSTPVQAQPGVATSSSGQVGAKPIYPPTPEPGPSIPAPPPVKTAANPISAADGFLEHLAGIAQTTAASLGLSPHLLLAQAALETGWGRKAIKDAAGQESHNLFGIKAGKHWTGKTVDVKTTEYVHGVAQQKLESFRAYGSFAESFLDYARLIKDRYGDAIANGATARGFGEALQAKGYATDPSYAQKIARVAQSVAYRLASRSTRTNQAG